jgi:hypothetical protein
MTRTFVQQQLLTHAAYIKKHDPRLLIHLIAQVCLSNFGNDDFHRKFVCLDNMEHLARLQSLDFISSRDIRILIEGLCKMTSRKQQVSFGFADRETNLVYCAGLNLIIRTLLKDVQKLELTGRLKIDDFTRILKIVSESESYRNLILMKNWQEFILKNQE